jgi:hypothetical protein
VECLAPFVWNQWPLSRGIHGPLAVNAPPELNGTRLVIEQDEVFDQARQHDLLRPMVDGTRRTPP